MSTLALADPRSAAPRHEGSVVGVEHLTHAFGRRRVVQDVSFRAEPGQVTALLGANGAGKSTIFKCIAGLVRPDEGRVLTPAHGLGPGEPPARRIGFALDASALHPGRSVQETLRLATILAGVDRDRVGPMLATVGLRHEARKRVGALSLGMRQRLALGIALIGEPRALVLDEPANGLDAYGSAWVHDVIRGAASAGSTVLISSHLLRDVEVVADRLVVIDGGRVVADGATDDLLRLRGAHVEAEDPAALARALAAQGVDCADEGPRLLARADPALVGRIALEAGVPLRHLSEARTDLQDLFLSMTTDRKD